MKKVNRVLLIDDSMASNSKTEALLKEMNVFQEILKFSDPKEAISSIEKEVPDLILLDINMPGMSGFNFLDEYIKLDSVVKSNFSAVISMLSEQVFSENFSESNSYKKYGVKNYLVKPIDREDIEDLISEHFTG